MFDLLTMPKAELHLHLDGTLTPSTLLRLAERHDALALLPEQALATWFVFADLNHFFHVKRTIKQLLRTADDFALVVHAAAADLSAQHVRYAEVTVTPYSFIDALNYGLTIDDLLAGLEQGRQQARRDFGIELRWVFDIPRNRAFANGGDYVAGVAERTLAYALLGREYGVIGLGLGGSEVNAPPEAFAPVFAEAKRHGLRSLPHAGESAGAASVWGAITALGADRIGHGVRSVEDESLLRLLAERQIPLEVNISSNIALGIYQRLEDHPVRRLDAAGVQVTINTDDPQMVGTTLTREYELLITGFGFSKADVLRLARSAFQAACAEPDVKTRLLAEFDQWAGAGNAAHSGG